MAALLPVSNTATRHSLSDDEASDEAGDDDDDDDDGPRQASFADDRAMTR